MRRAIVVGAKGQDGFWLTRNLIQGGRLVLGLARDGAERSDGKPFPAADILNPEEAAKVVERFRPDEIHYLAAFHHSSQSAALRDPDFLEKESRRVNVEGPAGILAAMSAHAPTARFIYASTCLVFGESGQLVQNEETPFRPVCVYGRTKAEGTRLCAEYRDKGLFASAGILYNHESERRRSCFLSQKIAMAAAAASRGEKGELILGDLSAKGDFGYAPDFMEAMRRILEIDSPGDFIVATGALRGVTDWLDAAYGAVGLDWREWVREDPSLIARRRPPMAGDASKLRRLTGWAPQTSFTDMAERMVFAAGGRQ